MMDVILRNDPHVMDFNEYWNADDDVYTEAVIENVKKVIEWLKHLLLRIVAKIRGMYNTAKLNKYKKWLNDPEKVKELKSKECERWDTDFNKELLKKACHVMDEGNLIFSKIMLSDNHKITDSDKHKMLTMLKEFESYAKSLPKEVNPDIGKWTHYDAISAIVDEAHYFTRFSVLCTGITDLLNKTKDNPLTDDNHDMKWIAEAISLPITIIMKENIGFRYGTSFGAVSERAGVYQGSKQYYKSQKEIEKVLKEGTPVKESYEYDLDELNAYIEYTMNDLHEAMELRNQLIQESDDDTVEDFEESDDDFSDEYEEDGHPNTRNSTINQYDTANRDVNITKYCLKRKLPNTDYSDMEELHDQSVKTKKKIQQRLLHTNAANAETNKKYKYNESYDDTIIRNDDEPVQENKTYCLRSNDMFTESYDEPQMPSRFYGEGTAEEIEGIKKAVEAGLRWAGIGINTGFIINISAKTIGLIKVIDSIASAITYNKKLGRFPSDIKRTMDILSKSKDGTSDTKQLTKALQDVKSELKSLSGKGVISYRANKNATYTEREEMKKLYRITDDLLGMLSKKPDKAAARRVSVRIEDFVTQAETVMKMLNRGKNEGDVIKEYMS